MEVTINNKRYKLAIIYEPNYIILSFTGLEEYCFNEVTLNDDRDEPFTTEELIAEIQLIQEKPEVYNFG